MLNRLEAVRVRRQGTKDDDVSRRVLGGSDLPSSRCGAFVWTIASFVASLKTMPVAFFLVWLSTFGGRVSFSLNIHAWHVGPPVGRVLSSGS